MIDRQEFYRSRYYKIRNNVVAEVLSITGSALETVRKRRGVSQLEAANLLGLSQSMLSHIEAGKRRISLELAQRVAEIFGPEATALPLDAERGIARRRSLRNSEHRGIPDMLISQVLFAIPQSFCWMPWIVQI